MEWFLNNLKNNIPFSFSRFNDGEMGCIMDPNFIASRGAQKGSIKLSNKLKECLTHHQDNYWVGIPCPNCYPKMSQYAEDLVGNYKFKTLAVDIINKNYQKFINEGIPLLQNYKIYWVGGEDQDLTKIKKSLNIIKQYKLPTVDGFSVYNPIKDEYLNFKGNNIVILSLGPLERILAKEWFEKNNKVTYLGLGSMFDPWTRGVSHSYHKGTLKPCKICN